MGNIFSAITGISLGDVAQKALQFVGVPKSFAAGVAGAVDLSTGNVVGALQNFKEMATGREGLSLASGLGLKDNVAPGHSCKRPSSTGLGGGLLKGLGFAAAAVVAGPLAIGAMSALGGATIAGGLAKMMAGIAGGSLLLGGMKGMFGGGQALNASISKMKRAAGYSNIDSEIAKLPPNATFEQMVHAFMKGAVKDQEDEVKELMDRMREQDRSKSGGIGSFFRGLVSKIPIVGSFLAGDQTKGKESRALMMEDMKFKIQTLSQMMQALSNVNNTMHQNSMNAIRNIRA